MTQDTQLQTKSGSSAGVQGLIVAAAFIGPGTITTATLVGAQTAYTLVWLLVFAVLATYILQEMASRVGRVSGMGLSKAIVSSMPNKVAKGLVAVLIIAAIGIGNAAYEGGNITGAALGLSASAGGDIRLWAAAIGLTAFILLVSGHYKALEKTLLALVMLMSAVFLSLMVYVGINSDLLLSGVLLKTSVLSNSTLALAIIGTTIVPYNLFLHAGMSAQNAQNAQNEPTVSANNSALLASLGLGGLLTFAVLSSSVTAFFVSQTQVDSSNIAAQMEPLLGEYASLFFGIGLFSAGLTSAITAPLATAYAISGLFNWQSSMADKRFLACACVIVAIGTFSASLGIKPLSLIMLAQTANAMLLPISALLLVWVCNKKELLHGHTNGKLNNLFGFMVIALVTGISAFKLFT